MDKKDFCIIKGEMGQTTHNLAEPKLQSANDECDQASPTLPTPHINFSYACMRLAMEAHATQTRKYTNEPYIGHLAEVAGLVATVTDFNAFSPDLLIAVAWLHDIMEDQNYTEGQLWKALYDDHDKNFSISLVERTIRGVGWLTAPTIKGSRAKRKAAQTEQLGRAPYWVQTIKCADIISNAKSIALLAPDFAQTYLTEKRAQLDAMTLADRGLWEIASELVDGGLN